MMDDSNPLRPHEGMPARPGFLNQKGRDMKKLLTACALLAIVATGASAEVLWDQSNWTGADGFLNIASNSCSQISGNTRVHTAMDVSFATDVTINSITIYERDGNAAAATQAYLWIAPKTGSMPTASSDMLYTPANLVTTSTVYVTQDGETGLAVTAAGLNIELLAGDYWVSLTPRHNLGVFPYSIHWFSADGVVGDPTAAIVACAVNSNWYYPYAPDTQHDTAVLIEGTVPVVPADDAQWGGIKALYR